MIRAMARYSGVNVAACSIFLFSVISVTLSGGVFAGEYEVNKNWRSIAIRGYDTVAYFTLGKAVKGKAAHEFKWQDARWRFSSKKHKEMFAADPDKYAPRFGGFCAGGISIGQKAPIDPKAWIIVEGQLYLNYDQQTRADLAAAPKQVIDKANVNWEVLGKK